MSAPWILFCEIVYGFFYEVRCCKFSRNHSFERICYFQIFQVFKVEREFFFILSFIIITAPSSSLLISAPGNVLVLTLLILTRIAAVLGIVDLIVFYYRSTKQ